MLVIIKIRNLALYLLCTGGLLFCSSKKVNNQWDIVEIDSTIPKNSIYRFLDTQQEIILGLVETDSLMKKSSDVMYNVSNQQNLEQEKHLNNNNCRAYFFNSDILSINIGISDGFCGEGFIINYKNKRFYTEPYYFTDVIFLNKVEPTYKIIYQNLILDKPIYSLGDSMYGYIDFKSIETKNGKKLTEHFGKGYFRTKVTKL